MCITKNTLPKLVTPKFSPQLPQKIEKKDETDNKYKNVKALKRILDAFPQNGLEQPSFIKITQKDGTSCEFGDDAFKKVTSLTEKISPVFNKNISLQLDLNDFQDILKEVVTEEKEEKRAFSDFLQDLPVFSMNDLAMI